MHEHTCVCPRVHTLCVHEFTHTYVPGRTHPHTCVKSGTRVMCVHARTFVHASLVCRRVSTHTCVRIHTDSCTRACTRASPSHRCTRTGAGGPAHPPRPWGAVSGHPVAGSSSRVSGRAVPPRRVTSAQLVHVALRPTRSGPRAHLSPPAAESGPWHVLFSRLATLGFVYPRGSSLP